MEGRRGLYDDVIFLPRDRRLDPRRRHHRLGLHHAEPRGDNRQGGPHAGRRSRPDARGRSLHHREIQEAPNDDTAFRVKGHMTVPLYTTEDKAGSVLTRDEYGMPYVNGNQRPLHRHRPQLLVRLPRRHRQYGHGLLGGGEVGAGYLAEMANWYGWIVFAVDWTGMKDDDVSQSR